MSCVLVTYSTNSGSTIEVANAISSRLEAAGHKVDVRLTHQVHDLSPYESVVIGAPMIFGWHNPAKRFLQKHAVELSTKRVAYFANAMRLTVVPGETLPQLPLTIDPNLASEPANPTRLSLKERFTTTGYYLRPMVKSAKEITPVSIAFFNGKLDMRKLAWWQAAFVMIVVQGIPGDYRDWDFIHSWGDSIASLV